MDTQCVNFFGLTDNGWDHCVKVWEVRYAIARDHLTADRNFDCRAARAAGLSSFNEAEHLNGEETSAVAKAEVPSLLKLGLPRNASELQRNRRAFQNAVVFAISGGTYAQCPIVSRAVTPDDPEVPFIPEAERLAARNINDASPKNRGSMPMARKVLPVVRYMELHELPCARRRGPRGCV